MFGVSMSDHFSLFKDANTHTQEQCHLETTGKFALCYPISPERCGLEFIVHVSRAETISLVHKLMVAALASVVASRCSGCNWWPRWLSSGSHTGAMLVRKLTRRIDSASRHKLEALNACQRQRPKVSRQKLAKNKELSQHGSCTCLPD